MNRPARTYAHAPIAADLRARILDGTHQPGEALPSIATLRATYRISDRTARNALQELKEQGLAHGRQGHGVYVTSHNTGPATPESGPPDRPARARRTHSIRRLNPTDAPTPGDQDLTTDPVDTIEEIPPPDVALALDADPTAPVTVERAVLRDQAGPVAVRTTYRTADRPRQVRTVITHTTARRPTDTEARALNTTRAAIVLIHDETHHDRTHPVAFVRTVYPADTIRLTDHYQPQT